MPTPVELSIKAGLEARLALILVASGYYTNAGQNILDIPQSVEDVDSTKLPCLYAFVGTEDRPEIAQGAVCYRSRTEYVVRGYVRSETPDDEIVRLKSDVKRAVLSDLTLGGTALWTEYGGGTTDYGYYEHLQRGVLVVTFDVEYQWLVTAP